MKKWNTQLKKKVVIATMAVIVLSGGGVVYGAQQNKQARKDEEMFLTKQMTSYEKLQKEINALFDDEKPSFLAENVTDEQVKKVSDAFNTLETKGKETKINYDFDLEGERDTEKQATSNLLGLLVEKHQTQGLLNDLFEQVVLTGSTRHKDIGVKEKTKKEDLDIFLKEGESEDEFFVLVQAIAKNGQEQVQTNAEATKKVDALFDKKDVSKKATDKTYKDAKSSVDKVLTKTLKDSLNKRLETVKKALDKQVAEKEKEEKQTAEASTETENTTLVADNNTVTTQDNSSSNHSTSNGSNWTGNANSGNTTGNGSTSGGNTGGGSTSGGNTNTGGGSTGNGNTGGGETTPPPTEPQQPLGGPGNSGMQFGSMNEAIAWDTNNTSSPDSPWFGMNAHFYPIYYPDGTEAFWTIQYS